MFVSCTRFQVGLLVMLLLSGCKVVLHSNLSEVEANKMMAVLLADGVPVTKQIDNEGITILVEKGRFGEAVNTVNYHGLPTRKQATLQELFPSDSLVASPTQEWIRFTYARSQELSTSIAGMQGVIRADVHIAEEPPKGPFEEAASPTVSVMVQVAREHMTEMFIPEIKNLVAFSVPNIEYSHVNVVVSPVDIEANTQDLVALWGLVMQRNSAQQLKNAVIAIGGLVGLAAIGAGALAWRMKKSGQRNTLKGAVNNGNA